MTLRYTPEQIDALKAQVDVAALAGELVRLRRGSSKYGRGGFKGPCPFCARDPQSRAAAMFECNAEAWVCAKCPAGGSAIDFIMRRDGLDFLAAVDRLGGVPNVDPETAARLKVSAEDKRKRQAIEEGRRRELERKRLFDHFWHPAPPWQESPVESYLTRRGLKVPPGAKLRFAPDLPFFKSGVEFDPVVLHRGPAMLAAILDTAGVFRGLHMTWIDLSAAGEARNWKALILDDETGEVLNAKKSRGTKQGGYIDLGGHPIDPPISLPRGGNLYFDRQFSGEGNESTLAVYSAMVLAGRDVRGIAWRGGVDLGNLVGAALPLDRERHPTLKDKAGRVRRIPGRKPDMTALAMPVLAGARELVQIADGDSDPFTTQCAMARGEARHARPGLSVRTIWPRPGTDFNSMLQGK